MRPTAAPAAFPYPDHRSMDQVLRDEADGCTCELTEIYGDQDGCPIIAMAQEF